MGWTLILNLTLEFPKWTIKSQIKSHNSNLKRKIVLGVKNSVMVFFWKDYVSTEKKLPFSAAIGQAKSCSLKYTFWSLAGIMFNVMTIRHKEKNIKSLIDHPYVASPLARMPCTVCLCAGQKLHPAHRLPARQGHCMALSAPWSNVGKAASSQVLNRVCIVLRPGDEGEGEGQDSHTTSALLYFLVDVSWKGWERYLWIDGTKKDLECYRAQVQEYCSKC